MSPSHRRLFPSRPLLSLLPLLACAVGLPAQKHGGGGGGAIDPAISFLRDSRRTRGDVHVMDANGTGATLLLAGTGVGTETAWSPDGTRLVLGFSQRVWVINRNGTGLQQVATTTDTWPFVAWSPVPAPDGRYRIVYNTIPAGTSSYELFLVEPDGGNNQQLTFTPDIDETSASWSPDATAIAVCREDWNTLEFDLQVLTLGPAVAGGCEVTSQQTLFQEPTEDAFLWWADWSRGGHRIAFTRFDYLLGQRRILIVDLSAPGQARLLLPLATYNQDRPSWSPDDTRLVFSSASTLYTVNADGSGRATLGTGYYPNWRR